MKKSIARRERRKEWREQNHQLGDSVNIQNTWEIR